MVTINIKSLLMHLNQFCSDALQNSIGFCVARTHYEITVEHFMLKLLEDRESDFALILATLGIDSGRVQKAILHALEDYKTGNAAKPVFSPQLLDLVQDSWLISSVDLSENRVRSGAILLAFLSRSVFYSTGYYSDLFNEIERNTLLKEFWAITKSSKENTSADSSTTSANNSNADSMANVAGKPGSGDFIKRFCIDFTEQAKNGKIDPVFGRDDELRLIIEILARRRKNNPICVGEPGVGKTSIVEGLALRVVNNDVPDLLKDVRVVGLDMGALEAGAGVKGEFENRLRGVINEIKSSPQQIILFIDEAHMLIGAGGTAGGSDAANLLKPSLARGELRTIAATTWKEYKKYFEKDPALSRRFQLVKLAEPSISSATLILRGLKESYEKSHHVMIRDDAVEMAVKLSDRYITDRFLPDKAIDLLDTSCARVKINLSTKPSKLDVKERAVLALNRTIEALERDKLNLVTIDEEQYLELINQRTQIAEEASALNEKWLQEHQVVHEMLDARKQLIEYSKLEEKDEAELAKLAQNLVTLEEKLLIAQAGEALLKTEVDPDTIAEVVADWTGIPLGKMKRNEGTLLVNLESRLQELIRGQDGGLKIIANSIRAAKSGLKNPDQPLSVFLFVGPSGTGKTECSTALADLFFNSKKNVVTINMSEFQESHTASRLIGSPPGYVGYGEGGMLTEAVRQRPYSVVLLDEVEKAHLSVLNVFYQVFDKGVANDGEGKEINFRNTIIILTSNLASDVIQEMSAGVEDTSDSELNSRIVEAINPILSAHFKPALLARMTVVPFYSLNKSAMHGIVEQKLAAIQHRLLENSKMVLTYGTKVVDVIVERCVEVETGARNIDFLLNGNVLPKLSRAILAHTAVSERAEKVHLDVSEDGDFSVDFS